MKLTKNLPLESCDQRADETLVSNPWRDLRRFTDARIGLGRAGVSIPTQELLAFQLAHAKAQDAVHTPLNIGRLIEGLSVLKNDCAQPPLSLRSRAETRSIYLQRPDYGRLLHSDSEQVLLQYRDTISQSYDLVVVLADGLSALAIQENAIPFLQVLLPQLALAPIPWNIGPVCIVEQGRVAVGDSVGEILRAKCVMLLVGERPGLSSPDSMGLYLTWSPKAGLTDAYRNCISNIREAGLSYEEASRKALYLLNEARRQGLSGVQLKDRTEDLVLTGDEVRGNFLVSTKG
ncbi:ethanolamine ammonia-lyase subunit EutC [Nitrincola tibetensis]|uniref:Ethanolamine ammonia-lyase small subunit n=1 Tax=Nitrincola tibetensis TaxID=2219697 RepID=A0A364NRS9_9GAMM|nr:ethanolamine ammonia-lyase subunit EutC [Nitrincola tibetensis]RAU19801.1 ethanolamine ammonia-lyase subunit EutC [Nitrincola tibetensis]